MDGKVKVMIVGVVEVVDDKEWGEVVELNGEYEFIIVREYGFFD